MSAPTKCHLWAIDALPEQELRSALQQVEDVANESHMTKTLYRCRSCGQRYLGIWYELIDWDGGDDRAFEICVAVGGAHEIERLKQLMPPPMSLDLLAVSPRLQFDGAGADRRAYWVGKDT
jgi:hypothetical protein